MRDDLGFPSLGKAGEDYDKNFFHRSYRLIEIFLNDMLAKGRLTVSTLTADAITIDGNTVPSRIEGTATFDPGSLADGAGTTTTVTVTGAALGDMALASFSLTTSGITITAWVSASNTVSVRFQNESGGTLDIGSGTLKAWALK